MSDPTQPQPAASPAEAEHGDVIAARALAALVILIHTDPLAAPFRALPSYFSPSYRVMGGELGVTCTVAQYGAGLLAAATALFGGTVEISEQYTSDTVQHALQTTWCGLPLRVAVVIPREDELTTLRKRLADLESEQEAARLRDGQVAEQRRTVADPAVPVLAVADSVMA